MSAAATTPGVQASYGLNYELDGSSFVVRENLLDILERELLGPIQGSEEVLPYSPRSQYLVGHIAPEAARGGPIALLREGDRVVIDGDQRELRTTADLAARRSSWPPSPPKVTHGALAKYAYLVSSASDGAITQPNTAVQTSIHIHAESNEGVTA